MAVGKEESIGKRNPKNRSRMGFGYVYKINDEEKSIVFRFPIHMRKP
jgi:hypothetical protein